MGDKLFPKEIIENSSEANFSKHSLQTKFIYLTVLGILVIAIIALPLIKVNVSVRSSGAIKPLTDRNELVSLVSGEVSKLYISENASVVRGQVVAEISAPVLQEQDQFNIKRKDKLNQYLADLSALLNMDASRVVNSFNSSNEGSGEAKPSPLIPYKQRILKTMGKIEEVRRQVDAADDDTSRLKAKKALTKTHKNLVDLLHPDSETLLANTLDRRVAYKQALAEFKQQVEPRIKKITAAEKNLERRRILHNRGIISDHTFSKSKDDVEGAWDQLLELLQKKLLPLLDVPPKEKKPSAPSPRPIRLRTPKYSSSLLAFKQQARNNIHQTQQAKRKFGRMKQLYKRDVISEATFEKSRFAMESARNDFQLLFEQQKNKWRADQVNYKDELEKLDTEQQKIAEKKDKYVLKAPISGTIQNMKGIYEGSQVSANQPLAEISPDTSLIAECYVLPKDVGLLKKGMDVRFQVSAFDYNQWGLLNGQVQEVSNDVTVVHDQPVFKVRCSLDRTWMELKNGYRGDLKKGMSLQARFNVTKRSLFQLLYDNLDDWLNPKWDQKSQQTRSAAL